MNKKVVICLLGTVTALLIAGCCCVKEKSPVTTRVELLGTNGPPPIEHKTPYENENPGTGPCGSFCNFYVYNNFGNLYTAVDNSFSLYLTYGDGGPVIPNSDYWLFWRRAGGFTNCAANYGSDQKTFTSVAGKKYTFTVYIKQGKCTNYMPDDIYLIPIP